MEHQALTDRRSDTSVTISVTHRVRPGQESEYEALLTQFQEIITDFPGYISTHVYRPTRRNRQYRTVFTFATEDDLQRWEDSPARKEIADRANALTENDLILENISGTSQMQPLALALTPFQSFVQTSVSGIGLLLLGTMLALLMANTPLSNTYDRLWSTELTIGIGRWGITESLRHWVNDALMALFFFILGLEIKREVLVGELRYLRQAALPVSAAIGGAIVPALVYLAVTSGGELVHGWGIPIATDTAFTLGILTLLGSRVRPLLLIFLIGFAIVDDIIAVGVIAIFYSESVNWFALGIAAILLGVLMIANRAGKYAWPLYAFIGVGVWLAIFESGVHGTLAGILVAMTVPARSWINPSAFLRQSRELIDEFERACFIAPTILTNEPQQQATQGLERLCEEVETPMTHLQHRLNPWVAFGVLPLFAFANAGIPIVSEFGDAIRDEVTWGIIAGLLIGKPIGILAFSYLAVRTGIAILPSAIRWHDIFGVALLGGIGFTMSLFITELALDDEMMANAARIGILISSIIAGAIGYLFLRKVLPPPRGEDAA